MTSVNPLYERPPRPAESPLRLVPEGQRQPDLSAVPAGRWLALPGRGRTWIREGVGPADAPTVVMLHGLGATGGLNFAGAHAALGDRFNTLTIDHRGHGRGIRTGRFLLEDCADDVAATIDALSLHRPIVVGYSMGGPIASLVWKRHPGLVGGLVQCATSRNFRGQPAEKLGFAALSMAGWAPVQLPSSLVRGYASLLGAMPLPFRPLSDLRFLLDEIAGHDSRALMQAAADVGQFNSSPWISKLDVPASVLVMTSDQIVPPVRQFRLARALPNATLHCVDAGHLCIAGGPARQRFLTALRRACLDVAKELAEPAA